MYLKRQAGPHLVELPDGTTMTRADLPDPSTRRWVASRKAAVVRGVDAGLLTKKEACDLYNLSEEELSSWRTAVSVFGENALKTTALQKYRQPEPLESKH
ncbi:CtrA inhibitor SciP [Litoreibacter roseus]|uniref:CtrA inhibitor SciP n=1 Tax=Litoreibacter roseus TaxID=2601869 RepID=UPI001359C32B|nr:DUF1153 domain-containing protein [Litoreibacter roseus]